MKKSLLLLSSSLFALACAFAQNFETATEAAENMRIGWNLGNTLDSNSGNVENMWIEAWSARTPENYETAWGQPVTTPALFKMLKDAGFNAVRVPVTWYPHYGNVVVNVAPNANGDWYGTWDMSTWTGYEIDPAWMARVKEIVDYAMDAGLYCILNVHHDTGEATTGWIRATTAEYDKYKDRFENLWTAIATEFKDYDQRLLFEGYNEMLDGYGSWCFASFAAPGNYNAASAADSYQAVNNFAKSFVQAVRATGGNNAQRNLIVNTYGACCGSGNWSSHLIDPLKYMEAPEEGDHFLFEVHAYFQTGNLASVQNEAKSLINNLKQHLVSKGAPVVIGEWGVEGINDNAPNRLAFAKFFIEQVKEAKMTPLYWMGLTDGADRTVPKWSDEPLKDAIVKGYYGEGGYVASTPSITPDDDANAPIYNLQGMRIDNPRPGQVYIQGGKKKLMK